MTIDSSTSLADLTLITPGDHAGNQARLAELRRRNAVMAGMVAGYTEQLRDAGELLPGHTRARDAVMAAEGYMPAGDGQYTLPDAGCVCRLGPDCPRPGRCDDAAIAAYEEGRSS